MVGVPKDLKADDSYVTYEQLKAYQEKQLENLWSEQLMAHAQTLVGRRTGQCVLGVRNHFGVPKAEVSGVAKSTIPNTQTGKVGHIIIFKFMSKSGHVGILIRDGGDYWTYWDSNGSNNLRGAIRTINKKDPRITGYRLINYKS